MSSNPPTTILVPGHWHTTTHLHPLTQSLTAKTYPTTPLQLPSVGLKSPRPTFADDVHEIYNAITTHLNAGKDVCLMLHSYAGMPGTEALNRLIAAGMLEPRAGKGKVVKVVFLAAYVFPAGFVMDAKEHVGAANPGLSIDEDGIMHMANPEHYFFNDLSPDDSKHWIQALDVAYYLGRDLVISSDDWRTAPVKALLCRQDNAFPPDRAELTWQGIESEWIDTAHSPFVSKPELVADILVRLTEQSAGKGST